MNGPGGAEAFRATAQVAALPARAERARVRGDVGRLHRSHRRRRAALLPARSACRWGPPRRHHGADRILKLRSRRHPRPSPRCAWHRASDVEEGRSAPADFASANVLSVAAQNSRARAADGLGHGGQRAGLARRRASASHARPRGPGARSRPSWLPVCRHFRPL